MRTAKQRHAEQVRRQDLERLFDRLEDEGFVTVRGNICCRSCAGAKIDTPENEGKPCAVVTEQDVEDGVGRPDYEDVYMGFGVVGSFLGDEGVRDRYREVGEQIMEIADELSVPTDWDGNPGVRILVNPSS